MKTLMTTLLILAGAQTQAANVEGADLQGFFAKGPTLLCLQSTSYTEVDHILNASFVIQDEQIRVADAGLSEAVGRVQPPSQTNSKTVIFQIESLKGEIRAEIVSGARLFGTADITDLDREETFSDFKVLAVKVDSLASGAKMSGDSCQSLLETSRP